MSAVVIASVLAALDLTDLLVGGGLLAAPSLSVPWAIVLFSIAIGLAITLSPSRRTYEIKRPKDE
jgi:hypothetical protein